MYIMIHTFKLVTSETWLAIICILISSREIIEPKCDIPCRIKQFLRQYINNKVPVIYDDWGSEVNPEWCGQVFSICFHSVDIS